MSEERQDQLAMLTEQVETLTKINQALMSRVERSIDSTGNAFSLFETNIILQGTINRRTLELERINDKLRQEIAVRIDAEKQIKQSLNEKEVLLKEIHHRVKNNLQIITSLLNLQASRIKDKKLEAMFRDSQGRVRTMALIHEKLYRSENLSEIDFSDYVNSLTQFILSSVSGNRGRISIRQDVDEVLLGVDIAVPCGLIINELVTNSLKYAYPNGEDGEILVCCKKKEGGRISLVISDNGVGIANDIDIENSGTLGMQLVNSLAGQLDGTIRLDRESGTQFTLEFKYERHAEKVKERTHAQNTCR